jgi:hypothetical protein
MAGRPFENSTQGANYGYDGFHIVKAACMVVVLCAKNTVVRRNLINTRTNFCHQVGLNVKKTQKDAFVKFDFTLHDLRGDRLLSYFTSA